MKMVIIALLLVLGIVVSTWYFFFFDNVVVEGKAYGFTIGMQKNDAVSVIKNEYSLIDNEIIISPTLRGNNSESIQYINVIDIDDKYVEQMDVWQIRLGGKETNVLVLVFNENKLEKMMRYRRAFIP